MLVFFITFNYFTFIFIYFFLKSLISSRIFHFKWKGYMALIFLTFCFLLCLFFCLISSNVLKMLIFFLGRLFCLTFFLESWISYFFLIVYVGGLFILLLYISTFSFVEMKQSYVISSIIFSGSFLFFFRSFSHPLLFVFFVNSQFIIFVILILFTVFLGLFFLSFFIPRGICSKRNF